MKTRLTIGTIIMMFVLTLPVIAGGKGELQKYFSDAAKRVQATDNPSEKREILNESFQSMSEAMDKVRNSGLVSKDDQSGIDQFKAVLQDKQDELSGNNGYQRVSDAQLNSFSNYVVQNMEQASGTVTISLVALLLIVILAVLIF